MLAFSTLLTSKQGKEGPSVILLHGFPYDVHCYDVAGERLAAAGKRVIVPFLRGFGPTRFSSAGAPRVGQQAALGSDLLALLEALQIGRATLAGFDWGGRAACVVAALWPERVRGLVTCRTAYNVQNVDTAKTPGMPDTERRHWYWFYLNSERGQAALAADRQGLCRLLWRDFSPTWRFTDATYDRTAAAFDNPDFVDVVLHSYRTRIGAVPGDPALDDLERRLAAQPRIAVPTVALAGADDGVDPPEPLDKIASHFADLRRHAALPGVGHNLPQEAPAAFADAGLSLSG
nr:alpha/beta hydrolase [uncultured Lichenicoccus sp.]